MAKQQTLQVDLSDVVRFLRSLGVDAVEVESYTIDLTQDSEMECGDGRVVNGIDLISLKKVLASRGYLPQAADKSLRGNVKYDRGDTRLTSIY